MMIRTLLDRLKAAWRAFITAPILDSTPQLEIDDRPSRIQEFDKYSNVLVVPSTPTQDRLEELAEAFPSHTIPSAHVYTQNDFETIGTYLSQQPDLRLDWVKPGTVLEMKDSFYWDFKSRDLDETVKVMLVTRHPSNALVEAGFVTCVVQNKVEREAAPPTARQYFIGFATSQTRFLMINERGNPSASAIANQIRKFITDSRRPDHERYYQLVAFTGNRSIGRFDGRIQQIYCDVNMRIEAQCFEELPAPVRVL